VDVPCPLNAYMAVGGFSAAEGALLVQVVPGVGSSPLPKGWTLFLVADVMYEIVEACAFVVTKSPVLTPSAMKTVEVVPGVKTTCNVWDLDIGLAPTVAVSIRMEHPSSRPCNVRLRLKKMGEDSISTLDLLQLGSLSELFVSSAAPQKDKDLFHMAYLDAATVHFGRYDTALLEFEDDIGMSRSANVVFLGRNKIVAEPGPSQPPPGSPRLLGFSFEVQSMYSCTRA
jgi:hypothetical protein